MELSRRTLAPLLGFFLLPIHTLLCSNIGGTHWKSLTTPAPLFALDFASQKSPLFPATHGSGLFTLPGRFLRSQHRSVKPPDFSISCTTSRNTITAGQQAVYTVTVKPIGSWNNALEFTVDGLPTPATAQFSPNPIPGSNFVTTLTVSNTGAVLKGKYTLVITARVITRNPTASSRHRTKCSLRVIETRAKSRGSTLTRANAQAAVQTWIDSAMNGGSVTISELHLIPENRSAEGYLKFKNLRYVLADKGPRNYSGRGFAIFSHYVDGRWVLTQVATANGQQSIIQNTIIEAK